MLHGIYNPYLMIWQSPDDFFNYMKERTMIEKNDETVDMDEQSKSSEVLDETEIEEESDKEPDSELSEDDEVEEVEEETIEEV